MAAKRAKRDARADRSGESASESYKDVNVSGGDSEPEGVVSFGSKMTVYDKVLKYEADGDPH